MKNYNSVLIIYNPNAMKGKIDEHLPYIKQRLLLRYAQVDAMYSPNEDGAEVLALKNASKYDIVVACGGDGTVNQVINGVIKSKANSVVAILPFGTGNDIARTLNIPLDLDKAIDSVLRLNLTDYDLMFDGTHYISSSLATGYLTSVTYSTSNKAKKRMGRFAYFLSCLKQMFKFKTLPITITCDGERIHDKFVYFILLNTASVGGFKINDTDNFGNGKVKMVLIKKSKFLGSFFTFVKLFTRGVDAVKKSKLVIIKDVKKVDIENHSNSPFTMDGEKIKFLKKTISISTPITIVKN